MILGFRANVKNEVVRHAVLALPAERQTTM